MNQKKYKNHFVLYDQKDIDKKIKSIEEKIKNAKKENDKYLLSFELTGILNEKTTEVFFILGDYFFIDFIQRSYPNHIDNARDIIESIVKGYSQSVKKLHLYDVEKSHELIMLDPLRNKTKRYESLTKTYTEVNYIYYNNAGKGYCISNQVTFFDLVDNYDNEPQNYEDAVDFVNKSDYSSHTKERLLKDLKDFRYYNNPKAYVDPDKYYKAKEELIQTISTQIKKTKEI